MVYGQVGTNRALVGQWQIIASLLYFIGRKYWDIYLLELLAQILYAKFRIYTRTKQHEILHFKKSYERRLFLKFWN